MTDNSKLQSLLDYIEISRTFSEYKLISITSKELYQNGFSISEQKQLLDVLANNYKYIKYSDEAVYKSSEDIPESLLIEYFKVEDMELNGKSNVGDLVDDLLAEKVYKIVTLNRFSTTLHEIDKAMAKTMPVSKDKVESFIIEDLGLENYNRKTGVLTVTKYVKIDFSNAGSVKRKDGSKYKQPELMEQLFKNVKTLKQGVSFSKIIGVSDSIIIKRQAKNIRNTTQEINNKVADMGGPDNLIIVQGQKVFINSSYLL